MRSSRRDFMTDLPPTTDRISWRTLALLSIGVLPFLTVSGLWLQYPSDELALYGIVPCALMIVFGTLAYTVATGAFSPAPSRHRHR
ncbi:MAG: hypothetical protein QGI32_07420 [Candidatus Latescibacteria bacterium]|jgi:hypothetical protein|nr:hypothetical protein [Gemmatimonadaceae bacterium]MDP6015909.1 hypothetical protein [Candidatus Latescibacterota bacterium]|tara:strand:- start:552 stop:809 length:258 start_codon:yes stop_codon:yes gene_type:complete